MFEVIKDKMSWWAKTRFRFSNNILFWIFAALITAIFTIYYFQQDLDPQK